MNLKTAKQLVDLSIKQTRKMLVSRAWQSILGRIEVKQEPEMNQEYIYLDSTGIITYTSWVNSFSDKYRLVTSNVFLTRAEVDKRHDQICDDIGEL